jgi:hypothetical protein
MSTSQELVERVRDAAEGSPYTVTETPEGFNLGINIVDAQWYTLIRKSGLKRVFTYEVRLDEAAKSMTIIDVANAVKWSGGTESGGGLSLHAEKKVQRGRVYQFSFGKEYGVDAKTGKIGKVADYSFNSSEGRDLIRDAAKELGWSEEASGVQKGAIAMGILGGGGALVAVGWAVIDAMKG